MEAGVASQFVDSMRCRDGARAASRGEPLFGRGRLNLHNAGGAACITPAALCGVMPVRSRRSLQEFLSTLQGFGVPDIGQAVHPLGCLNKRQCILCKIKGERLVAVRRMVARADGSFTWPALLARGVLGP
jgi:hypothetical protein